MDVVKNIILSINTVEPPLILAVKRLSHELGRPLKGICLVDKNYADKPGRPMDNSGLFEEIVCNFDNHDELQSAIKPFADNLLAVTCRLEGAIPSLRQALPFLPYLDAPSESSLLWSTEKSLMRDRLANYDQQLVPRYQAIQARDVPYVEHLIADFVFPVIVKPSNLAKSLLVTECHTMRELQQCLQDTFSIIEEVYEREQRRAKPYVLIEELIEGDMYSIDAYVSKRGEVYCLPPVRVWTAHNVGLRGYYGFRIMTPVGLQQPEIDAANKAAEAAIKALNLRSTSTHIELFKTERGWKIIELGARIGGYRESLYREAYGIEHFYNDLKVRIGDTPELPIIPHKYATGLNIYAEQAGIIESIRGVDAARRLESVVFIGQHAQPGDKAMFADQGGDLIVDAILSNVDAQQLEADVQQLLKLVVIKVTADSPARLINTARSK